MIRKLCDVLDTTPTYLIDNSIHIENKESDTIDSKTFAKLLSYYSKLNDKDKATINQLIETLSDK
jgi:hypothetical protein